MVLEPTWSEMKTKRHGTDPFDHRLPAPLDLFDAIWSDDTTIVAPVLGDKLPICGFHNVCPGKIYAPPSMTAGLLNEPNAGLVSHDLYAAFLASSHLSWYSRASVRRTFSISPSIVSKMYSVLRVGCSACILSHAWTSIAISFAFPQCLST